MRNLNKENFLLAYFFNACLFVCVCWYVCVCVSGFKARKEKERKEKTAGWNEVNSPSKIE